MTKKKQKLNAEKVNMLLKPVPNIVDIFSSLTQTLSWAYSGMSSFGTGRNLAAPMLSSVSLSRFHNQVHRISS